MCWHETLDNMQHKTTPEFNCLFISCFSQHLVHLLHSQPYYMLSIARMFKALVLSLQGLKQYFEEEVPAAIADNIAGYQELPYALVAGDAYG